MRTSFGPPAAMVQQDPRPAARADYARLRWACQASGQVCVESGIRPPVMKVALAEYWASTTSSALADVTTRADESCVSPACAARDTALQLVLALGLAAGALLVLPGHVDAFEAGKRLVLLGAAVMALLLLSASDAAPYPACWSRTAQLAAAGVLALLVWAGLSAVQARSPELAWASIADGLGLMLFVLVGAHPQSRQAVARGLDAATLAVAANALISLLQWTGWQPITLDANLPGGRFPTGALFGNEGQLALACALLLPWGLWRCWQWRVSPWLRLLWVVPLLLVAAIAINRQLTAALAAGLGVISLVILLRGQWRLLSALALAGLVLGVLLFSPSLRTGVTALPGLPSTERLQSLSTQRVSAWAAAEEMRREHPWFGLGAGHYAAHAEDYRLRAEQRLQLRLPPPVTASGFAEAHNDFLQASAELGWPGLLLGLGALACVLIPAFSAAAREPEAGALCAMLVVLLVSALAWFPLHYPFSAALGLLVIGRVWRLVAGQQSVRAGTAPMRWVVRLLALQAGLSVLSAGYQHWRGGQALFEANARLERVLRGNDRGDVARASIDSALEEIDAAERGLPFDQRVPLSRGVALILSGRPAEAEEVLRQALRSGARAELHLNLGRALAAQGRETEARPALLRAAWASPLALATLPRELRNSLLAEVAERERALRSGDADAIPVSPEPDPEHRQTSFD